jgi:hypothetical protein
MIKTLFASACVLACCMGNEYPAKAYGTGCDTECFQYRNDQARQQRELDRRFKQAEQRSRECFNCGNNY